MYGDDLREHAKEKNSNLFMFSYRNYTCKYAAKSIIPIVRAEPPCHY